jgi:hypothetical protein
MRTLLKRWWFWAAAILLTAGIAVSGVLIHAGQGKLTRANFDKIREGMTRAEVFEILGDDMRGVWTEFGGVDCWTDGPSEISVVYGSDHRVAGGAFDPGTVWERIKHVFGKRLPESLREWW